jgi:hypothetical protein
MMTSTFKKVATLFLVFLLVVAGGLTAHTSFAATESVSVDLTVGTSTDDEDDDEDDDQDDEEETDEPADDDRSRSGQSAELLVDIADVRPGQQQIEIVWETTVSARSRVRWQRADGSGQSYLQASDGYGRTHTTRITGLTSGTRYEITLTAESRNGQTVTRREAVQTELPDGPQGVANLQSNLTGEGGVQLSWSNPPQQQFDYIRVVRSDEFFSNDPLSGALVYEGVGRRVTDNAVQPGQTYFYSAFTRSADGQWSAPALTAVYVPARDDSPRTDPIQEIVDDRPEAPQETKKLYADLTFADLIFSQGQVIVSDADEEVTLDADKPFSVGLDYDKLPEVLKTVVVTMTDPDEPEETFSFLLRADNEKDFYKATVGGLEEYGTYQTEVSILDYKYRRTKTLTGQITVEPEADTTATTTPTVGQFADREPTGIDEFVLILLILLIMSALIIWYEDRRQHNEPVHS